MKVFPIPTGYLFSENYTKGELETLSIADYGKHNNVKANFLGLTNPINGVKNQKCLPLSEKWVITLSTQYGCQMTCNFCDCPNIQFRGNVTSQDLYTQLINARKLFPEIKYTERLNIHFARMGEPIFNTSVFDFARKIYKQKYQLQQLLNLRMEVIHPVLTTCLPKYKKLKIRIAEWLDIKNYVYNGQAGFQFSINSTDEKQRQKMFDGRVITLEEFAEIAKDFPNPISRKYCLNFAYATGSEVDSQKLSDMFDKERFMVKITPIHNNNSCRENNIKTVGGYDSYQPYQEIEQRLVDDGWDVLIFVPSLDEEDGLVTCGNTVLGGGKISSPSVINIQGIER